MVRRVCNFIAFAAIVLWPAGAFAQAQTGWPAETCAVYADSWNSALDTFGIDNLNFDFIAEHENFIAGGCATAPSVCPQSSQEIAIADALSVAMAGIGATLPASCAADQSGVAAGPEVQLCLAQLDLLQRANRLTEEEAAVFQAQCDCLEAQEETGIDAACAQ
jgi:hypothetical protein